MYKVVKNRNFLNLLIGGSISLFGTLMQSFALSLYVLAETGSAVKFASILAVTTVPKLFLAPIAGYVADKVDKRKWMVLLDCFSGILTLVFGLTFFIKGSWSMIDIYLFVIILSIISTFSSPIDDSTRPLIIKKDELVEANSIVNTVNTVISLVAAILGGVLYSMFGIFIITAINGISFFILAIMESFIVIPKIEENKKPQDIISGIKEGFLFVINDKKIFMTGIVGAVMNFTLASISVGMIIIGNNLLKLKPWELGLFESAGIVGSILGAIMVPMVSSKLTLEKIDYFASILMSMFFAIFAIWVYIICKINPPKMVSFIITLMAMVVIVTIVVVLNITLQTFAQTNIPKEIMGRATSSMGMMILSAKPLGEMFFGSGFDKIGYSLCYLVSATVMGVVSFAQKRDLTKEKTSDIIIER